MSLDKNELKQQHTLNSNSQPLTPQIINTLLKQQLITELHKRNLITTGLVPELKERLIIYLKGESIPNDFSDVSNTNNMDNSKKPFCKPGTFSGLISENIDLFIKKYNRAASINAWSDTEKIQFLPLYLEGSALTFYDNNEPTLTNNIKWTELEQKLITEFKPTAQLDMLKLLLEKRTQLDDEQTINYINDIESLCKRINPLMSEAEMIHKIMKGLKPNIIRHIGIIENNTLKQLKDNIRKYEMIEFMITGETVQSHTDIKNNIITEQINQITNKFNEQIKTLNENNDKLKKEIESLNETHHLNLIQNNTNNSKIHPKRTFYQTANNFKKQCEICSRFNHTKEFCHANNNFNNKINKSNIRQQCNICSRNNHLTENCFFKKDNIKCQLCLNIGHQAQNCFKYLQQSKN